MGRKCQICESPYRDEYDELFLPPNNWSIKDIWRHAINKRKENFGYESIRLHFRRDIEPILEAGVKSNKLMKDRIEEEISKTIEVSENLRRNLSRLQELLDKKLEVMGDEFNKQDVELIVSIVKEIRFTYQLIFDYSENITLNEPVDMESMHNKVIKCMLDARIPDKYLLRFTEQWKKQP